MSRYDEAEVVRQIKALPRDVKAHLSHVARNGMVKILSAHCRGLDVAATIREHEKEWEVLDL